MKTKGYFEESGRLGRAMASCRKELPLSHLFALFSLLLFTACSMIDEDLSDCGKEAKIDYELELITNMSIELETVLDDDLDKDVAEALREYLKNIFTDYAHDVDLSFYDTQGDSARLHHDQHIMDANQKSYTLYLPMQNYMHLAAANLIDNRLVNLTDDSYCHPSKLQQAQGDTITPHTTGLFTARQLIKVLDGVDQAFLVRLYMANCAAALVVDTRGYDVSGMKVVGSGFASRFSICDSTFVFDAAAPVMKADEIMVKGGRQKCFCSVNFPSREPDQTRTVIETEDPFVAQADEASLWEFHVYVPRPESEQLRSGSSITETVLRVNKPLRAGQLKIIKVRVRDDGSVEPESPEVGASVTLDWKPGNTYNPNI
jgi:hypothetical protein